MGLIRAAKGAAGGVFGDQWKEYFYCGSMSSDTLVSKSRKKTSRRSSNRHGSENIISNGSVIAVNDGQCMIIVEQGKVVDVCAEPGEYVYDSFTEPSLFCSDLEDGIVQVFDQIGKRFGFGGETPEDQRVYFINTKELTGNKYGTPGPVPFRVIDANLGLDIDISVRCFGEYSYRIANPILFYTNVCGNVESEFTREELDGQLRSELMTALQPAFARISAMGIRYSAAHMVGAQASAMQAAASNQNAGPAMAFAGMNMASNAGGVNPSELFAMARNDPSQRSAQQEAQSPVQQESWVCSCGNVNKGKFCSECGNPRPSGPWVCSCGTVNKGKFCSECGRPRP